VTYFQYVTLMIITN